MSEDTKDTPKPARKPLGLKRSVEPGEVKQTFSHGRTNKVVVEVKRKKLVGKPGAQEAAKEIVKETPVPAPAPAAAPAPKAAPKKQPAAPKADDGLTRQEMQAKLLREAEEARLDAMQEARKRDTREKKEQTAEEKKRAEENRKAEEEQARKAQEEIAAAENAAADVSAVVEPAAEDAPAAKTDARPPARKFTPVEAPKRAKPEKEKQKVGREDRNDRRQSGKLTVNRALRGEDGAARARSLAALKRAREKEKRAQRSGRPSEPREKQVRDVIVPEAITVQELAKRMGEKGAQLVKSLFNMGSMVTVNQTIDQDTAELLVEEFGHNIQRVSESDVEINTQADVDPEETLKPRPPVVTIMGHVDHGKTSLLDALRGTDVVAGEAGGITQHIGAYQVTMKNGDKVTFLDTPGHEAFTEMRMRGANVTDIVILVVAADDGLMPQTIEAINHTKAAGVPMIVAINKIDKEGADPTTVRTRLLEHEVIVEEMSGDVLDAEVSALKKIGLDELMDKIHVQAELLELKARPDRPAEGAVVEAKLDIGRGPVATVLIERGTLKRGDVFVVGSQTGKVRAMIDDKGQQIKEAGPSTPVEVLGISGVPSAGDKLTVVENEARAREVAAYRAEQQKLKRTTQAPTSLENMFSAAANSAVEFPVLVKADVQGSTEAIVQALNKISNDDIKVRILHSGVGAITESDVTLAGASKAPIIGFNVRPNAKAREIAKRDGVRFKYFDIIYDLTDDIRAEMAGELGPEKIENVVGRAEVKDVFKSGKKDKAAGLLVTEGVLRKGLFARLTRDDVIVSATTIASLRRFKDDVEEVRAGMECGAVLEDTNDIKPGDMLEVFQVTEKERIL
ncbi:MAG: translation initiation factor IF-2 [Sphingomonadales bacterium]|nr:translation initiation factor IF-2 [Sphingomonadales bacterium]PIX63775.1 MAG: translation initiation factor IF-2 [Sphingomonadales bacterium CG_4_10_14_3_um_filter_58_15]NCO49122.1 translation initiation factor IF-2 [Sphingomonadales bacterium]NCP00038.1 translation initiation factor IF-2 [Sphingomonadales bacterium]NCP27313.1 translation initiation factor IF-2 [Sphingomonadales bacterium]